MKPLLTAVILTCNEEKHVLRCLDSLQSVCEKTFVIDSGSQDRTREIASNRGAQILTHAFETHVDQWRWALGNLPKETEWILGLDADQYLSPELTRVIRATFQQTDPSVDGFYMRRSQIFRGKRIRFGGYGGKYLLKLFRRSKVILNPHDRVEHHFYITGPTRKLAGDLIEDNLKEQDLSFWIQKHLRYARFAAEEELLRRGRLAASLPVQPAPWGTPDQRSAWAKQVWYHLPLYGRVLMYFFFRYVLLLGFLDGREGFRFHLLQGLWYRLLVDAELDSLRK